MPRAIVVENVSKTYRLGETRSTMLREVLVKCLGKLFGRKPEAGPTTIQALNGVSLEIEQGEIVGLLGRNGAGKSTLLKILSRITYPNTGSVNVHGRVGSLLEVGTGFHDELTGRENIYLNGSILGMTKREIDAAMDQIVSFADIDQFLDTPIKRYSSGMRMRLGFSVAAHLSTDVLFVDEVLAVGDVGFQKKCLSVMRELGQGGRTVVFVSHNMAAIENLCPRAIWIAGGKVEQDGPTTDVIRSYLSSFGAESDQLLNLGAIRDRQGSGKVRFTKMEFLSTDGGRPAIQSGDALIVRLHYECEVNMTNLHFGLRIFSGLGTLITDAHTWTTGQITPLAPRGHGSIDLEIDFLNVMPGVYYLGIWAAGYHEWHDVLDNVTKLDVEPADFYGTGHGLEPRFGLIFLPFRWIPNSTEPCQNPIACDIEATPCEEIEQPHYALNGTAAERAPV
jgi:lipopolysaccharide transport system ATP-binding protein